MNDFLAEYFTLHPSKSNDKGNGVAIFCAIVSIVACSYSLNVTFKSQDQASDESVVEQVDPAKPSDGQLVRTERQQTTRTASHSN